MIDAHIEVNVGEPGISARTLEADVQGYIRQVQLGERLGRPGYMVGIPPTFSKDRVQRLRALLQERLPAGYYTKFVHFEYEGKYNGGMLLIKKKD